MGFILDNYQQLDFTSHRAGVDKKSRVVSVLTSVQHGGLTQHRGLK